MALTISRVVCEGAGAGQYIAYAYITGTGTPVLKVWTYQQNGQGGDLKTLTPQKLTKDETVNGQTYNYYSVIYVSDYSGAATRDYHFYNDWYTDTSLNESTKKRAEAWLSKNYIFITDSDNTKDFAMSVRNDTSFTPTTPVKSGYSFQGWKRSGAADNTAKKTLKSGGNVDSTQDTNGAFYYAVWQPVTVIITYRDSQAGTIRGAQGPTYNSKFNLWTKADAVSAGMTMENSNQVVNSWNSDIGTTYALGANMVALQNLTLWPIWSAKRSHIRYYLDGVAYSSEQTGSPNVSVLAMSAPTLPTGKTFDGWYTSSSYTGTKYTPGSSYVMFPATDGATLNLYGRSISQATYDFYVRNTSGSWVKEFTRQYEYGTIGTFPTKTTSNGYTFWGWYESQADATSSGYSYNYASMNIPSGISQKSMYGVYSTHINIYVDGTQYSYLDGRSGTTKQLPSYPTKTGYTFDGWYTNSSYTGTKYNAGATVSLTGYGQNVCASYYGRYKANDTQIQFYLDGVLNSTKSGQPGTTCSFTTPAVATGKKFDGWYNNSSYTGSKYTSASYPAAGNSSLKYYGRSLNDNRTITFKEAGTGTTIYTNTQAYGTAYVPMTYLSNYNITTWKTGYTPTKITTDLAGNNQATNSATLTSDITYYIVYSPVEYTLSYNVNSAANGAGATLSGATSAKVSYNGYYVVPANSAVTPAAGFSMKGWYSAASGGTQITNSTKYTTAGNSTIYAQYTAKTFTVNYNYNYSGIPDTVVSNQLYGSNYTNIPTESIWGNYRAGYMVSGWYTQPSGGTQITSSTKYTTAANSTVYARWAGRNYTCRYDYAGGKYIGSNPSTTIRMTYGEPVSGLPSKDEMQKTDSGFSYWLNTATGQPIKNGDIWTTTSAPEIRAVWTTEYTYNHVCIVNGTKWNLYRPNVYFAGTDKKYKPSFTVYVYHNNRWRMCRTKTNEFPANVNGLSKVASVNNFT